MGKLSDEVAHTLWEAAVVGEETVDDPTIQHRYFDSPRLLIITLFYILLTITIVTIDIGRGPDAGYELFVVLALMSLAVPVPLFVTAVWAVMDPRVEPALRRRWDHTAVTTPTTDLPAPLQPGELAQRDQGPPAHD